MKHVYHLHLNGSDLVTDKAFGIIPGSSGYESNGRSPEDMSGGWRHCAEDVETLVDFVLDIIQNREYGTITANRLIITRYSKRLNDKSPRYKKFLQWNWHWDATEEDLKFVNSGLNYTSRDRKKLTKFVLKKCNEVWERLDINKISKRLKQFQKKFNKEK